MGKFYGACDRRKIGMSDFAGFATTNAVAR